MTGKLTAEGGLLMGCRLGGVRGLTVRVTVRATKSSRPAGLEYEDPQLKAQAKSEMWQRKYLLDLSIVAPTVPPRIPLLYSFCLDECGRSTRARCTRGCENSPRVNHLSLY
jgi:hypothetical protein